MSLRLRIFLWLIPLLIPVCVVIYLNYSDQQTIQTAQNLKIGSLFIQNSAKDINDYFQQKNDYFNNLIQALLYENPDPSIITPETNSRISALLKANPGFSMLIYADEQTKIQYIISPTLVDNDNLIRNLKGKNALSPEQQKSLLNSFSIWKQQMVVITPKKQKIQEQMDQILKEGSKTLSYYLELKRKLTDIQRISTHPPVTVFWGGKDLASAANLSYQTDTFIFGVSVTPKEQGATGFIIGVLDWSLIKNKFLSFKSSLKINGLSNADLIIYDSKGHRILLSEQNKVSAATLKNLAIDEDGIATHIQSESANFISNQLISTEMLTQANHAALQTSTNQDTNAPEPNSGYRLVGYFPDEDIYFDIKSLAKKSLAILLFSFLWVSIILFLISSQLIRPISKLGIIAHKISLGNFEKRINVSRNDEVGDLINSLNSISEKLSRNKLEINKSNDQLKKLTDELENKAQQSARLIQDYDSKLIQIREKTSHRSQDLFNTIFDNIPGIFCLLNKRLQLIRTNKVYTQDLGYSEIDLKHKNLLDFIDMADRELLASSIQYASDYGMAELEANFLSNNGAYIPYCFYIRVVKIDNEPHILGMGIKINPLKRLPQTASDAVHLYDESEHVVGQAALRQVELANQAKADLLMAISHEVQDYLDNIFKTLQLLMDNSMSYYQKRQITLVHDSTSILLNTINDIIDFAKIESGQIELAITSLDPRELVENIAIQLAAQAHEKGLELIIDLPLALPATVHGDSLRLRQVLLNLINNAIEFTERGEIVVSLRVKAEGRQMPHLHFAVEDTGIGIEPELQAKIFHSFTLSPGSTQPHSTGLDLATARGLVHLMGGDIGVESAPGVGSRFWFTVPLEQLAVRTQPCWLHGQELLRDKRVLIVDDNATHREILHHQIMGWSMVDEMTGDASWALTLLHNHAAREEDFDIAIIDLRMAGVDAFDLVLQINADSTLSALKLVLLASDRFELDAAQTAVTGANVVLKKPVRQAELYEALYGLLNITSQQPDSDEIENQTEKTDTNPFYSTNQAIIQSDAPLDSPLDQRVLARIRRTQLPGKPDLLPKLISHYLQSSPELLEKLHVAIADENGDALRQAAQTLKSSSIHVGARWLAAVCSELEQRGREWQMQDTSELLEAVDFRYNQVRMALETEIRST